ncbi:MAG: metallophosphoesterase [Erysipelotrichaceae bacterium]|nr:metallophosphoesterase [Erysipelotrichaceae bacterium]
MENLSETYDQYLYALKRGRKTLRRNRRQDLPLHPEVLDEIVNDYDCSSQYLGEIDVPADLIVGTKTSARTLSFSADFMPLLKPGTEFAAKWREVCAYHLSDTGIAEAPTAYEYLGRFYILEGNKRVSVLKSYGAVFITLEVTRLLPPNKDMMAVRRYQSFLNYYELSKLYSIQFSKGEYYSRFQKLLGFEEDHVWTRRERIDIVGLYGRVSSHLKHHKITGEEGDCFLALLELYGYEELSAMNDTSLDKAVASNKLRLSYGHGPYRIMCLADEEDLGLYSEYARSELKDTDFLISCGDLKSEYLEFLVTMSNKPLFYVHGNHDGRYDIEEPGGCICIDDDLVIYQGIRILGLGGSYRYSQDKYQYTEVQMQRRIRKLRAKILKAGGVDIVVTHAPIKGYGDMEDYAHQGFECFEKLLNELHPRFWLYGHVHLRYDFRLKRELEHKQTRIINCNGKYEIIY